MKVEELEKEFYGKFVCTDIQQPEFAVSPDRVWEWIAEKVIPIVPPVILPSNKKTIKDIREMFDKYYDYVYTTDDGEQRGEWKETFAISVINYFNQRLKAKSK